MDTPVRSLQQVREAVGETPAVVRVKNLQTTVLGPRDAWGRSSRPQPMLVSATVELRRPFRSSASSDRLESDTIHYGQLSEKIRSSAQQLESAAAGCAEIYKSGPLALSHILMSIWRSLTHASHNGKPRKPFLDPAVVRCLELTASLPKATLTGAGASLTIKGAFHEADQKSAAFDACARTLRLHDLSMPVLIGLNDNERNAKQTAVINVEVDNLESRKDAHNVVEDAVVKRVESSSFMTIEALAADVAEAVTLALRREQLEPLDESGLQLKISVEKPIAVPFADAPCVELRINTAEMAVAM